MGTKLKSRNTQFNFVKEKYDPNKAYRDKVITVAADNVTFSVYLILRDEYGFGARKLQNFFHEIVKIKQTWRDGSVEAYEMYQMCEKKGFGIKQFLNDIPTKKKLLLMRPYKMKQMNVPDVVCTIDAALILCLSMTAIVLNEKYKFSAEKIRNLLRRTNNVIDCMTTLQPVSRKPYITQNDIVESFRDDMQLDLISGKRWKDGKPA